MEIRRKRNVGFTFDQLNVGEIFATGYENNDVYIKINTILDPCCDEIDNIDIDDCEESNAINLVTGFFVYFNDVNVVQKIKGYFVVEE